MPIAAGSQDIRSKVLAAVDKAFAEPVRFSFMREGQVDPSRAPIEIKAPLRVGGGKETNIAGGFAQDWRSRLAAGKAELSIDADAYTGPAIKKGDKVRALSRRSQPWFEVLRVDDRGENRLVLELGEV